MKAAKKVELLAPAGNAEAFYGAIHAGADAIYLGGSRFGARAYAENFSEEELVACIRYAHLFQRKVYLTVNTLVKESEFSGLYEYVLPYYRAGLDGVIIQDMGVFAYLREHFPGMELHGSTQMTITGEYGAAFLKEQGACRVVPARELSLAEIRRIKEVTGLEIECFIHGAMCYCYSGQCLFSSILGGRSGNRGRCAQPCRLPYTTGKHPKECYPLSLKDMCTIEYIPELLEAGIDSFKIEGRMKTALYVATVARTYRKAIDDYFTDPKLYEKNMDWYQTEISKCTYRQFTTGFYFGKPDENTQIYDNNTYVNEYIYLGIVEAVKDNLCRIEQRNKFCVGDTIEIMKPDGTNVPVTVEAMYTEDGESVDSAPHPKQVLWIKLSEAAEKYDLLRCKSVNK